MVMKLYGMDNIFNVQRAILPLFEVEVDTAKELELVKVSLFTNDNLKPAYTAKQPFGLIPYFEDNDIAIFESRAIARYIAEKYDGLDGSLLGKTLKERAAINQWVESEAQNFYPPLAPMMKEIYVARAMSRPMDEELMARCTAQLCKVLDVYEAHLSSKQGMQFLTGDEFTFADVMHTPYLWQVKQLKAEVLEPRPHVAAYAARITARPGFQKLLQLNWDAAQPLH
ncbi:hypothetical protein M758_2G083900 [Ceratodon purpureus]|nr:hypothetical protein M758_2G083900 [Ceratodon purpureus]